MLLRKTPAAAKAVQRNQDGDNCVTARSFAPSLLGQERLAGKRLNRSRLVE